MRSLILFLLSFVIVGQAVVATAGDNGDGTYTNPPLYADYPDPDIIRVGDDFYFASTTFVNSPGLVILHSKDLVNWETAGYVVDRLDGNPHYDMNGGTRYRNGIFAPSLRYRDGTFYVAVTPVGQNTRICYSKNPNGPWKYHELNEECFDPGLLFDDDGKAYIFTSGGWDGHVHLKTLSPELDKIVDSREAFYVKGIEGSKALKINGWYYLFNALPSRLALMCSRAKKLDGPWETIEVLDDRTGGHQGALVDLPDGTWYGFVMCDKGPIGRVTNISPITWKDEWPLWGEADAVGKVPDKARKPIANHDSIRWPRGEEFDGKEIGLNWQWNHNPDNERWSLTERPGFLRLKATKAPDFWNARNSLTHKGWGPTSCAIARLDISHLAEGDRAGLGMIGKGLVTLAVERADDGQAKLVLSTGVESEDELSPNTSANVGKVDSLQLALHMDYTDNTGHCGYSTDGKTWTAIGEKFPLMWDWRTGTFQGQQYAVFCYNPEECSGYLDVDSIRFADKPLSFVTQSNKPTASIKFESFKYSGTDPYSDQVKSGEFLNPILTGFYPDPSLCRVEDDYYLINSTFAYFPAIPIFHSKDLVNWRKLGHVIDRPEQLDYDGLRVSEGIFAPAITHHDGTFYVICTMVGGEGNFVVTAKNPEGPWSDATQIQFEGIDPSIFFDDDGRAWIVNNGAPEGEPQYSGHRAIWIQEFDHVNKKMIGPRTVLINGGIDISKKPVWIEGPHIYKHNGWYYLCCAEGGTGPNHSQVILRSREVQGPYKPWEKNPILTQRDLSSKEPGAVTCTGHADLEIGPDGKWWAVFLGVRPYDGGFSAMGRETFLLPVTWTDDDWPTILPPGERVPMVAKSPKTSTRRLANAISYNGTFTWVDEFDEPALSSEWIMLREPKETWWKVDDTSGCLQMTPSGEHLSGNGNPSFLARRVQHAKFEAELVVQPPQDAGVSAGLAVFQNEQHHYFLAVQRKNNQSQIILEKAEREGIETIESVSLSGNDPVKLVVRAEDGECSFSYAGADGKETVLVADADAKLLTTAVAGGFVGATIGPHARLDSTSPRPSEDSVTRRRGRGRGRFGGPIVLGPDDKPAFADPPAEFNEVREDIPHGKLEMIEYDSKSVGTRRKLNVYTPPDYSMAEKYPVLYLLHGIGGDETEWERFCKPQVLLDNLIADGNDVPMVVVMPNGRAQKNDRAEGDVFAKAPAFEKFEIDLVESIIPFIESSYSVSSNRKDRALAGFSMGGGQSLNFGLKHLDKFAWVGAFSSAPNTKPPAELITDPNALRDQLDLLWLSCGKKDGLISISQGVHTYLKKHDIPHVWHVDSHGHDPTEWSKNLHLFAQRLFK
jgi:xylan 1,4-beta-xylosidase